MHNTYSLRAILESDLDPTLCKLMLHEIKSPLLQHSFQLTTDDEVNGGSFSIPGRSEHSQVQGQRGKQKNIDHRYQSQREREFERMHQRLNQMSLAMTQNQTSRRQVDHSPNRSCTEYARNSNYKKHKTRENIFPVAASLVSPLQFNSNVGPNQQTNINSNIQDNDKFAKDIGLWCGDVFDLNNAYENQLVCDYNPNKNYVRKKIFTKERQKLSQKSPKTNCMSFSEAIDRLRKINEPQLAQFLSFISKILSLLAKTGPYRARLQKNQNTLNKMLLTENPIDHQFRETISNQKRIINRLKVNKISQALPRLFNLNTNGSSIAYAGTKQVDEDLCRTLQYYSEVEDVIQNYVSRGDIVNELNLVYNFLFQSEISHFKIETQNENKIIINNNELQQNQEALVALVAPVTHSRLMSQNLSHKMKKIFSCLQINSQQYANLSQLSYIWNEMNQNNGYLPCDPKSYKKNREKFINQLCRNDILVHEAVKGIYELNIERKLSSMGFQRNRS